MELSPKLPVQTLQIYCRTKISQSRAEEAQIKIKKYINHIIVSNYDDISSSQGGVNSSELATGISEFS